MKFNGTSTNKKKNQWQSKLQKTYTNKILKTEGIGLCNFYIYLFYIFIRKQFRTS